MEPRAEGAKDATEEAHKVARGAGGEPLWHVALQTPTIRLGACVAENLRSGRLPENDPSRRFAHRVW